QQAHHHALLQQACFGELNDNILRRREEVGKEAASREKRREVEHGTRSLDPIVSVDDFRNADIQAHPHDAKLKRSLNRILLARVLEARVEREPIRLAVVATVRQLDDYSSDNIAQMLKRTAAIPRDGTENGYRRRPQLRDASTIVDPYRVKNA